MVIRALLAGRSITTRLTDACLSFCFKKSRTSISAFSMVAKFWLFANHLEDQFLFSARRKPRGSIFCPMIYPLVAHKQRDVAGLLFNAVTTAFCACREALQARALVHIHRSNFQSIDVCAFIVLGVGNSRLQHFFSNSALFFGENVRMFNACSTDLPRIRSATRRAFVQTRGHFSKQRKLSSRHLNVSPSYRPHGL